MAEEEFTARRGQGASCDGSVLRVSDQDELRDALLATGFPTQKAGELQGNLYPFADFAMKAQALRRDGSAALDLCYVAAGRFDGFWEPALQAWDVAAGVLIVQEAGGRVTDYAGAPHLLEGAQLVASNGKIHAEMLAVLQRYV
jgi:myo-inositol-1(or 4)-monophosphatase